MLYRKALIAEGYWVQQKKSEARRQQWSNKEEKQ